MKKNIRVQKGITLIALIIMIVLLLMLSLVVIIPFSDYDLINRAEVVAQKINEEEEKDRIILKIKDWLVYPNRQTAKTFYEYLKNIYGENNVIDNSDGTYDIILETGNVYNVRENGTIMHKK